MFLFQMSALGTKFAVTRPLVDIPGIIIIAYVLSLLIPKEEVREIYRKVESM